MIDEELLKIIEQAAKDEITGCIPILQKYQDALIKN
jgi:hypothetical protein